MRKITICYDENTWPVVDDFIHGGLIPQNKRSYIIISMLNEQLKEQSKTIDLSTVISNQQLMIDLLKNPKSVQIDEDNTQMKELQKNLINQAMNGL